MSSDKFVMRTGRKLSPLAKQLASCTRRGLSSAVGGEKSGASAGRGARLFKQLSRLSRAGDCLKKRRRIKQRQPMKGRERICHASHLSNRCSIELDDWIVDRRRLWRALGGRRKAGPQSREFR